MLVPSFAKINWTLEILGKRPDNYHELRTLLQTVDLSDKMTFSASDRGIELTCDNSDVPCDPTNLIWQAALLLQEHAGCTPGARIHLEKRIPIGAGLGGGSSNAAISLLALARLWNFKVAPTDLFRLGAQLGADVPFFFFGGTGIGIGRGDEVYPVEDIAATHLLLVNPGVHVPTRQIYGNLPSELTSLAGLHKMPLSLETAYASMKRSQLKLRNDLEIPALALYPVIGQVKKRLTELKATSVLMSGSGSTVFAVFESDAACLDALTGLSDTGWWCVQTRALRRQEYQTAINGNLGTEA